MERVVDLRQKQSIITSFLFCVLLFLNSNAAASPTVASDLVGTWLGTDTLGTIQVILSADMRFIISHPGCDLLDEVGTYTADESSITVQYDDGASQVFRYLMNASTMLLADETLLFPVVLTRTVF